MANAIVGSGLTARRRLPRYRGDPARRHARPAIGDWRDSGGAGRDRRGVTGFVRERARPAPGPTSTSLTRCSAAWWCGCYPEGFVFYEVLPVS